MIEINNLTKNFDQFTAIDDLTFTVKEGEVLGFLGPNGAGKSTLVRIVLGLIEPDSGSVVPREDLRIGYMPQKISIDPTLPISTCRFLQLANTSHEACHEALATVDISHLVATPIQKLSGGELQRALLARAIVRKPNLLVLDEPVQGVDVNGQDSL